MIRLALVLSLCASAGVCADDQDTIDYRQHVMKSMGEQMAAIGMILEQRAPADNLALHLQVLAAIAPQAKAAFTAEVAGGNAKPEVWSEQADFAARLDELVVSSAGLAEMAKGADMATIAAKLQADLNCKGCHDSYRMPLE